MYSPPFHRRILPWVFAIVFFVAAPALVFYTAGYRWNPKKQKVERHGTLILDTRPTDARIILNGTLSEDVTPVTLQNTPPGRYLIRLELDGYHSWQKTLDVHPEFVTFANDVRLWKISDPMQVAALRSAETIEASPNQRFLAMVTSTPVGRLIVWTPDADETDSFDFPRALGSDVRVRWSEDSRALFIEDPGEDVQRAWLVNVRSGVGPLALPRGNYRWNGTALEGTSDGVFVSIRTEDGAVTRTMLPSGVVDQFSDVTLRYTTGTQNLVLFQNRNPDRGIILPAGAWRIYSAYDDRLILRDGSEWLSLDPDAKIPQAYRVTGDMLRPVTLRGRETYLLVNGGEVWHWNPDAPPELLFRESRPIMDAAWHASGQNIALASEQKVAILNLDARDGRIRTILSTFDAIRDIALMKTRIYIAGKRDGVDAIWELEIE